MNNSRAEKLINLWYFITAFALILAAVKYALPLAVPFIFAGIVAVLIKKPVNYISNKIKIKREIVSFFAILLITSAIVFLLALLIYSIYAYLSDLIIRLPELLPKLNIFVKQLSDFFSSLTDKMPQTVTDALNQLPSNFITSLTSSLTKALTTTATKLPSFVIAVGVTVFACFLVTRDYYKLGKFLVNVMPKSTLDKLKRFKSIVGSKTFGMMKGYALLTLITYIILIFGFLLLGISYAPAIAALVAFIDFLPILGTGIVLIPWAIICIFKGELITAIGLAIIYIVATVARNALSPKVLGDQIKLDSLTVLISMYVGYGAFGITGMILAPFIAAVIRDIFME